MSVTLPFSGQEVVVQIGGEVIRSGGLAAEGLTIAHLLDITETAGHALATFGVEMSFDNVKPVRSSRRKNK